ncbi:MAG: hypothetical protein R3F39_12320 [Myxococcota bacterium]
MDDQLLDELGAAAGNRRAAVSAADARWQALAEGRADAAESAAAKAEDPERWAAYQPLDAAAREAVHRRVAEALGPVATEASKDNVISLQARRESRWRRVAMIAVPLAAAAVLMLLMRPPSVSEFPPVDSYSLEIGGGQALQRGPENRDVSRRFVPDSQLELVLRPATPVESPLALRAWRRQADGAWQLWEPAVEWSADGAARIVGNAGALLGTTPGRVELRVVVGRSEVLPDSAEAAGHESAGWRRFDAHVEMQAAP